MCLIIHLPAGATVSRDVVEGAAYYNADGIGIMQAGTATKWLKLSVDTIVEKINERTDVERAIHFRMATDGTVTKANVHPFKLKNQAWLMHNGILSSYKTGRNAKLSDTRRFVDEFCNPMIAKHGSIPISSLNKEITGSAIALMSKDGKISRYGSGWVQHFGLWFSNEYAWDAPRYTRSKYNIARSDWSRWMPAKRGKYIYDDYEDEDVLEWDMQFAGNRSHDDETADLALSRISLLTDVMPLEGIDYIAYEDLNLHEEMLNGTITDEEFLGLCTSATLLNLYGWAAKHGYYLG